MFFIKNLKLLQETAALAKPIEKDEKKLKPG